ncbi:MAG: arabinogalactan endo-1,4-beta-galactosidase [Clostridiales bacterium]|nr:arabinogalactan endo-1,4-beta-galactosidase [Clostridiales bacterium]
MMKKMIYGVDLGWVTQLESMGYRWLNESGEEVDILAASEEMGVNAVRLRVFVNPPYSAFWQKREDETCMLGYCDAESVLEMAERVKVAGMQLMIDFHYSDYFADPQYQLMPKAWEDANEEQLEQHVYGHTKEVLQLLSDHSIVPDWVQVGNEINHGMMWPAGSLEQEPEQLVRLLNAGYEAVKAVCPDCQVITHLASVCSEELCEPFLKNFFAHQGKTDILGFSYYPYWERFKSDKDRLAVYLKRYAAEYHKPVMIVEVGGPDTDEEECYRIVRDAIEAMKEMTNQEEVGVFYWESEAISDILPDHYPLCASKLVGEKTLRYNMALCAFREDQE